MAKLTAAEVKRARFYAKRLRQIAAKLQSVKTVAALEKADLQLYTAGERVDVLIWDVRDRRSRIETNRDRTNETAGKPLPLYCRSRK